MPQAVHERPAAKHQIGVFRGSVTQFRMQHRAGRAEVAGIGGELRWEYHRALNYLDPQAIRRLVRQYLTSASALYLNGPYFLPRPEDADRLSELLRRLGGGSQALTVPVVDDEPRRRMITDGLAGLFASGEGTATFIEPYVPLGLIPEEVWAILEQKEGP